MQRALPRSTPLNLDSCRGAALITRHSAYRQDGSAGSVRDPDCRIQGSVKLLRSLDRELRRTIRVS
jgi:hypothetical protein